MFNEKSLSPAQQYKRMVMGSPKFSVKSLSKTPNVFRTSMPGSNSLRGMQDASFKLKGLTGNGMGGMQRASDKMRMLTGSTGSSSPSSMMRFLPSGLSGVFSAEKLARFTSKGKASNISPSWFVKKDRTADIKMYTGGGFKRLKGKMDFGTLVNRGFRRMELQKSLGRKGKSLFGDADGDRVLNVLDCEPFNKKFQDGGNEMANRVYDGDLMPSGKIVRAAKTKSGRAASARTLEYELDKQRKADRAQRVRDLEPTARRQLEGGAVNRATQFVLDKSGATKVIDVTTGTNTFERTEAAVRKRAQKLERDQRREDLRSDALDRAYSDLETKRERQALVRDIERASRSPVDRIPFPRANTQAAFGSMDGGIIAELKRGNQRQSTADSLRQVVAPQYGSVPFSARVSQFTGSTDAQKLSAFVGRPVQDINPAPQPVIGSSVQAQSQFVSDRAQAGLVQSPYSKRPVTYVRGPYRQRM